MTNEPTENAGKFEPEAELNPLMAVYNPQPPETEQPARFYWQEPWHGAAADAAVQAAFES